jgi:hypothetical protein
VKGGGLVLKDFVRALGKYENVRIYPPKVKLFCANCGKKELVGYFEKREVCLKCVKIAKKGRKQ